MINMLAIELCFFYFYLVLSLCLNLRLRNNAPIEPEEVEAMNRLLAHMAGEPRPVNPKIIYIPKVS